MNRRAFVVLLLAAMVGLAACGQPAEGSVPGDTLSEPPGTTTTITTTTAETTSATTAEPTVTTTTAVSTTTTQERKSTMSTTSATKPATTTAPAVPYPHVALDNPALKYTGRTMVVPGEAYLDWSASGLELAVTGGTVEAQLYGVDLGDNNQRVYMAVYVNGRRTKTFYLENGLAWYTLAETLPENTVSAVRLVRLTEASQGKASLFDLKVTGKLAPRPADKPHRIEWIGDSLTCGYGVLGASQADPFLASTEDVTKTYAWLCAEALNAEMSVVAASGYGIGSNWAGKEEQLIPDVFPYYNSLSRSITEKWEYSRYQPELVVINLGTNDFNGCQGSDEGASRVRKGIVRFLTALRAAYPDATICWVYGFCGDGYGNVIRQSVEAFAAADGNAAYIPVSVQNAAKNGYGSGWHPNAASNEDCAAELLPQLKKLMNW